MIRQVAKKKIFFRYILNVDTSDLQIVSFDHASRFGISSKKVHEPS